MSLIELPDLQMSADPITGWRLGQKVSQYSNDVVTAYQGMMQSRQTGHTVPDPSNIRLVCQVTGQDVTDEIHHADFVRRQASHDIWGHMFDAVRDNSENKKVQDETYEPVFEQWKQERCEQTGKRCYLDAHWDIPTEQNAGIERRSRRIRDEFVDAHPTLRVPTDQLILSDKEHARLRNLEEAHADAERQWYEVMERYGYRYRLDDPDSECESLPADTEEFSHWLACGYRTGEDADTEFDPVSDRHFRPWRRRVACTEGISPRTET